MPFEELAVPEPPGFGTFALAQVDAAARLDNPDWQILLKLRADGFETLLPDVQAMRSLARALKARFHAEVAGGRIDDAIRTAKTMFAMSTAPGRAPHVDRRAGGDRDCRRSRSVRWKRCSSSPTARISTGH